MAPASSAFCSDVEPLTEHTVSPTRSSIDSTSLSAATRICWPVMK